MNTYFARRRAFMEKMEKESMLVLYSGEGVPCSMDECYPFEANHHFFYLTGIRRQNFALVLAKTTKQDREILFIEEPMPLMERWTGKRLTIEETREISGIRDVRYMDALPGFIGRCAAREHLSSAYFDCYRNSMTDTDSFNMSKARAFAAAYPTVTLRNAHPILAGMRMVKDESEIATLREAIAVTDAGLRRVMANLAPGRMEYQTQADFEYEIALRGAESVSFPTIAGSGLNGCMMHYGENCAKMEEGSLVLLDLGARVRGYCADITRTYPVSGKYSPRQKEIYDIVLEANREVARVAKPGMTLAELNNICKGVLARGMIRLGKIEKESEIGKYYMHSVSHHLGIDTHDAIEADDVVLAPGMVISDEPGLYIDEEKIGIRIEDDVMITETGCEVLSEAIPRTTEEIEAIMAQK